MLHNSIRHIMPGQNFLVCFSLLIISTLFSCKKYSDTEFEKPVHSLTLTSNKTAVVLREKDHSTDALQLMWTPGSNNGTHAAIRYTLKIDKQGNNFSNAVIDSLGKGVLSKKYTVKDLNNLLLNNLGGQPGEAMELEAVIVAEVAGEAAAADTSRFLFSATPYRPVTSTLYLIGDATPGGWNANNPTELTGSADNPGIFHWQGRLYEGEFKFITTTGEFIPSYNKGESDNKLVYRETFNDPDEKFVITSSGSYAITVNLLDSTIDISAGPAGPPVSELWIVGDATPNGWNIDNPNKLRVDRSNPFVFTFNEILKAGEFKFPTSTGDWNTDFYMPMVNYQNLSSTDLQLVRAGGSDLKWKITDPGAYKIKIDLETMKIEIKKFTPYDQLWLVGDATPTGWNIDNPTPLVKDPNDPYVFTWEGNLNAGELKIPVSTGSWFADFFMPMEANEGITSTEMRFTPNGSPDNKWKITEAGTYKITINQLYETIKFEKQ